MSTNTMMGKYVTATKDSTGNVVGLSAGSEALPISMLRPNKIASLGDSIATKNCQQLSYGTFYQPNSWLTWAQMRLGWSWEHQLDDNYAVSGKTTAQVISEQLPLLRAVQGSKQYQRAFISSGTNEVSTDSVASMIENFSRLLGEVADMGIIPVHIGLLPSGTAGGMTDAKRKALRMNDWLANYAAKTGALEFIPGIYESVTDNSAGNGYWLSTMTADGIHPNTLGAWAIGEAIYNYYAGRGLPSALNFAQSQADIWDATYNKSGHIFASANPLLLGGTSAPTGMSTNGGTGPYVVSSKGTRTLVNGQTRATVDFAVTNSSGGTLTNGFLSDTLSATEGWDASERIQEGDVVYGQAIAEITSGSIAGLLPYLQIFENDGTDEDIGGCALFNSTGEIGAYANGTILTLRTPNMTVRPYSGSGTAKCYMRAYVRAPDGTSAVVKWRAFEFRKVL